MRVRCALFCLFALTCSAQPTDDAEIKHIVMKKVIELNDAVMKEDLGKVADLTHPKVVELLGGRDKMIAGLQEINI
jgi:hypothetical protein